MGFIYEGLKMSAINATESVLAGSSYLTHYQRFIKDKFGKGKDLIYVNNRDSRSVAVRIASQVSFQSAEQYINKYARLTEIKQRKERKRAEKAREEILKLQDENVQQLIKEQSIVDMGLGSIACEGGKTVTAITPYGDKVPEALFLYYDDEVPWLATRPLKNAKTGKYDTAEAFPTKTRFFYDLAPSVSQSTSKEIILTKVQGRDQTRKEMVAGGDIVFSVNGSINSDKDGEYPSTQVSRFIEIMQHCGVIKVNHLLFRQFNVTQVIIQDFKLEMPTYKNIQPYSFTCVAVEPDDPVVSRFDTITLINNVLAGHENESWYQETLALKKRRIKNQDKEENKTFIGSIIDKII